MKIRLKLDTLAGGVLALLAVLVGMVILFGEMAGIRVSTDLPKDGVVSPLRVIQLKFSEPVDFPLVAQVVSMEPVLEGYLEWVDSRTVQFVPLEPFALNTVYQLTISPEILNIDGRELKKSHTWEFTARDSAGCLSGDGRNAKQHLGNGPERESAAAAHR